MANDFSGVFLDADGNAIGDGSTVNVFLYAEGTTTPVLAQAISGTDGVWAFNNGESTNGESPDQLYTTPGRFDIKLVNGTEIHWLRASDQYQVTSFEARNARATTAPAAKIVNTASGASNLVAEFAVRSATESSGVETADTPSDNDEAYINLNMTNDNATPQDWTAGRITWIGVDVSDGSEDADLEFETMVGGSLATALKIGTSGASGSIIKDEDNMASDSATHLATQQSIKAYVDSQIGSNNEWSEVLGNGNTSGANDVIIDNGQGLVVGHTAKLTVVQAPEFQVLGTGAADSQAVLHRGSANGSAAGFIFSKSRAALGSQATVVSGDGLGEIRWYGDDGTDNATESAKITVLSEGTIGTGRVPAAMVFYTGTDAASTVSTEALRIDSSQNVSIGSGALEPWVSTYSALQLGGNGSLFARTATGANGDMYILNNAYYDGAWKYQDTDEAANIQMQNGLILFNTAASGTADTEITWVEALRIDSSQNTILPATKRLYLDGGTDTYITEGTGNRIDFIIGGTDHLFMSAGTMNYRAATAITTQAGDLTLNPAGDVVIPSGDDFKLQGGDLIQTSGINYIGDTANANMTVGLTINQGANDDEILALKSSDVAHGVTTLAETDTFGTFAKRSATTGGVDISGYSEATVGLEYNAVYTSDTAVRGTTAVAPHKFDAQLKSTTTITDPAANQNLLVIQANGTTRFIFDSDGDSHQDVGTAWTNFDVEDDVQLTRSLGIVMDEKSMIQNKWDDWGRDHRADLVRVGVVTDDPTSLVNMTQVARIHNGAIGQLNTKHMSLVEEVAELKSQLKALTS